MSEETERVTRDQWLALVARDLKGADFERKLVGRSLDGLRLEPLYDTVPSTAESQRMLLPLTTTRAWRVGLALESGDMSHVLAALSLCADGGIDRLRIRVATRAGEPGVPDLDAAALHDLAKRCAELGVELALDGGQSGLAMLAALRNGAAARGLRLDAGVDVLGEAWTRGAFAGCPLAALDAAAKDAGSNDGFTSVRVCSISSVPLSSSGATASQEIAWIAAALVEHLRAADRVGTTLLTMCERSSITIAVDRDFFREIAKVRAMRRVVARVLDACGLDGETAPIPVHAVASPRTWSALDPWTNLLRGTVATVAAAAGGVDSITVPALDEANGQPGELGLRLARNTQLVLQHESHVGAVSDPGAGSYAIETETDALAQAAWTTFQSIEAEGGLIATLRSGSLAAKVRNAAEQRRARIVRRQDPLTGVSEYAALDGRPTPGTRTTAPVGNVVAAWSSGPDIEQVATVPAMRDSAPYEALRARAATLAETPRVFVATSGPLGSWKARGDWTSNALAAGGFAATVAEPTDDAASVSAAFAASGARVAVTVCADDRWDTVAGAFASALRGAGATRVILAGKPADGDALRAAGIDAFVHVGCDLVALLDDLLDACGVPR